MAKLIYLAIVSQDGYVEDEPADEGQRYGDSVYPAVYPPRARGHGTSVWLSPPLHPGQLG